MLMSKVALVLEAVGAAALVIGVALWSLAAGLVVAGVLLILFGVAADS